MKALLFLFATAGLALGQNNLTCTGTMPADPTQAFALSCKQIVPPPVCTPTPITPYVQVNGGVWLQSASATVASGSNVNMGPQPISGGSWSWTGPGGFTSTQREVGIASMTTVGANTFIASYTDPASCGSKQNFVITVSPPAIAITEFIVAPNGNDTWSGTLPTPNARSTDGPFKTIEKAHQAMRASTSIKTTSIRAGTYLPPATSGAGCNFGTATSINLTAADNGQTYQYYAADGYNSAILDGGATSTTDPGRVPLTTLACAFGSNDATNITINGLQFRNWVYSGVHYGNEGPNPLQWTITNNIVHDIRSSTYGAAGIFAGCSTGSVIAHNYVYNAGYSGIEIGECANHGALQNVTVSDNVVINTCIYSGDCGAIYAQLNGQNMNVRVLNNYVRDINANSHGHGSFTYCCATGVYLDAYTYGLTVAQNVVTGVSSLCVSGRGGQNTFTGNLCDIGTPANNGGYIAGDTYSDGAAITGGSTLQHSIIVGATPGTGYFNQWFSAGTPYPMVVSNNAYFNYNGSTIVTTGNMGPAGGDYSPVYVNPQLTCWAPKIAAGSPALSAPVSFPGIIGGWGPPGFVMPQTGTPPSWPHTC
jgi:hypothetical protein